MLITRSVLVFVAFCCSYSTWHLLLAISRRVSGRTFTSKSTDVNHKPSESFKPTFYWPISSITPNETIAHTILPMNEDLILYKSFSQAMRPSTVIPYYYRASEKFDRDDITITTLVTGNRFSVLARLAQVYQGDASMVKAPISLTLLKPCRSDFRRHSHHR